MCFAWVITNEPSINYGVRARAPGVEGLVNGKPVLLNFDRQKKGQILFTKFTVNFEIVYFRNIHVKCTAV